MRRLAVLVILAVFFIGTIPAFADQGQACAGKTKACGVVLPFQPIADTLKPGKIKEKNKLKPLDLKRSKEATNFQTVSDSIKKGSEEAKKESLRTPVTK